MLVSNRATTRSAAASSSCSCPLSGSNAMLDRIAASAIAVIKRSPAFYRPIHAATFRTRLTNLYGSLVSNAAIVRLFEIWRRADRFSLGSVNSKPVDYCMNCRAETHRQRQLSSSTKCFSQDPTCLGLNTLSVSSCTRLCDVLQLLIDVLDHAIYDSNFLAMPGSRVSYATKIKGIH